MGLYGHPFSVPDFGTKKGVPKSFWSVYGIAGQPSWDHFCAQLSRHGTLLITFCFVTSNWRGWGGNVLLLNKFTMCHARKSLSYSDMVMSLYHSTLTWDIQLNPVLCQNMASLTIDWLLLLKQLCCKCVVRCCQLVACATRVWCVCECSCVHEAVFCFWLTASESACVAMSSSSTLSTSLVVLWLYFGRLPFLLVTTYIGEESSTKLTKFGAWFFTDISVFLQLTFSLLAVDLQTDI